METRVLSGERPEALSRRLASPLCAILRINRLYSAAWLTPGRVILAPWRDFCRADGWRCVKASVNAPAKIRL